MSFNWAFWGAVGIALGAAYLLWLFQRTMLGEVKEKNSLLKDLSWREIAVFAPLIVVGLLDRPEPAALLPRAGTSGGQDRGARASGLLRRASPGESPGRHRPKRRAAVGASLTRRSRPGPQTGRRAQGRGSHERLCAENRWGAVVNRGRGATESAAEWPGSN